MEIVVAYLQPGYHSNLEHANGQEYPGRPDNMDMQNHCINNNNAKNFHLNQLMAMERRIRDAIDNGFVVGVSKSLIFLKLMLTHLCVTPSCFIIFLKFYSYF